MAKTMTASVQVKMITNGQIESLVDKFRAAVRKHRLEVTAEAAQLTLGVENFGMELYAVVRKHVENFSNMLSRTVPVNRTRSPQQALDATCRVQYTDAAVVAAMPRGEGTEMEVHFFKESRNVSDDELEKAFGRQGLKPVDPITLAALNEADPAFADTHPNGTHWRDADGRWCFAAFDRWHDERDVHVNRYVHGWRGVWWFAGVCK